MSYRLLADDVAGLLHALDLHKPLIVGFSDGGQAAAYLAWVLDAIGDQASPEIDTARFSRNHPAWAAWLQQIYGPTDGSQCWPAASPCG